MSDDLAPDDTDDMRHFNALKYAQENYIRNNSNMDITSNRKLKIDAEYWANLPSWEVVETIYLCMNLDPRKIDKNDTIYQINLPFIKNAESFQQLILRAISTGELDLPITPLKFLIWAQSRNINMTDELKNLIQSNHANYKNTDTIKHFTMWLNEIVKKNAGLTMTKSEALKKYKAEFNPQNEIKSWTEQSRKFLKIWKTLPPKYRSGGRRLKESLQ